MPVRKISKLTPRARRRRDSIRNSAPSSSTSDLPDNEASSQNSVRDEEEIPHKQFRWANSAEEVTEHMQNLNSSANQEDTNQHRDFDQTDVRADDAPRLICKRKNTLSKNPRVQTLTDRKIEGLLQIFKQIVEEGPFKEKFECKCFGNCSSSMECYTNAQAYLHSHPYLSSNPDEYVEQFVRKNKEGIPRKRCHVRMGCASITARHKVIYHNSGEFKKECPYGCGALHLPSEYRKYANGKMTECCENGTIHTELMQQEDKELNNPPAEFLAVVRDKQFVKNDKMVNNLLSFSAIHGKKAPPELLGGRPDTCKYNGEFSFHYSDLIAPNGQRPKFAQYYTLLPEEAVQLRKEASKLYGNVSVELLKKLEPIMRTYHPFGRTFAKTGDLMRTILEAGQDLPRFKITLLSDRDINLDEIKDRPECQIIRRADAPTSKQVAVVWVDEDGNAPAIPGFWIFDKAGAMRELKHGMPALIPSAFPLLSPLGTFGWRFNLKKNPKQTVQIVEMPENADSVVDADEDVLDVDLNGELLVQNDLMDPDAENPEDSDSEDATNERTGEDARNVMQTKQTNSTAKSQTAHRDNISARSLYKYRFALRGSVLAFHWLWSFFRLAEYFVIIVLNLIEKNQLDFVREKQRGQNMRKIIAKDYVNAIEKGIHRTAGGKLGQVFLMPYTFAGSRQYYQSKYADLMTIVRHLGNPTWFATFTGNPKWPEIQAALHEGQDFTNRPDIVCRIFMDKMEEFLKDVLKRNVLGSVRAWGYSVEHQKRGMPHVHLLIILDKECRINSPEQVDKYVCARIPPLPNLDDFSPEAHQQRRLWRTVTTCMLHDCNAACNDGKGGCRKHFPKPYSDQTVLSAERYAQYVRYDPTIEQFEDLLDFGISNDFVHESQISYKRLRPDSNVERKDWCKNGLAYTKRCRGGACIVLDDSRVVSYNPFLLTKYDCHINIEFVFGQAATKYLFKYLLKGFEQAYVRVAQPGSEFGTYDYDELNATFKVRFMTAMEAYLRLFSYKIVGMSHRIYTLTVHEENGQNVIFRDGYEEEDAENVTKETKLTAFFNLCMGDEYARQFRYDQIPYYYIWDNKNKRWKKRKYPLSENVDEAKMFVRIFSVSPKKPELLAIRTLLMNRKGPKSFEDLRTVNGNIYATFTEAAQVLGLLQSDAMFVGAMIDACAQISSRNKLIQYFAMLLCHANPADPQMLFDQFLDQIFPAPTVNNQRGVVEQPLSRAYRTACVMRKLEFYLRNQGSNAQSMGLRGLPLDYDHEKEMEENETDALKEHFYGDRAPTKSPKDIALEFITRLNQDQKIAFQKVEGAIRNRTGGRFFLEGGGGCGKTFLYNTIIRWCLAGKPCIDANVVESEEHFDQNAKVIFVKNVVASASTGIAGILLIGGGTTHRQFFVPNNVNASTMPRLSFESVWAMKMRDAELLIIDEISMLHRHVLEYIHRMLADICQDPRPFGNKTIIVGGDWKQLCPVVKQGSREEQIAASVKMSALFKDFQQLRLTINMRTSKAAIEFSEWLINVGNGMGSDGKFSSFVRIPNENQTASIDDIIEFCFPSELLADPLEPRKALRLFDSAILCPRNEDVWEINDKVMKILIGKLETIESIDQPLNDSHDDPMDKFNNFRFDSNIEAIQNETPSGFPPHILSLKVGSPIMLLRNMDISRGLCNGTRLQITKITPYNLTCNIMTGPQKGQEVLLPQINFEYGRESDHRGLRFKRMQFPVRPCFGMTINKSQGQTLQRMGLVLKGHQCFGHGQLYVAFSRVTSREGIRVFSTIRDGQMWVLNVVYKELLDQVSTETKQTPVRAAPMPKPNHSAEDVFDDYFD